MKRLKGIVLVVGAILMAAPAQSGTPPELAALSFLLGEWDSGGSGAPGEATGGTTFALELQGRVIVRRNHAEYPASDRGPASRHDDLMVIYVGNDKSVQANYYDNEGHVIHYTATAVSPTSLSFVSDAESGSPRFRLSYVLGREGLLEGEFAMAPPDQPESFVQYLTWESRRISLRGEEKLNE